MWSAVRGGAGKEGHLTEGWNPVPEYSKQKLPLVNRGKHQP